jgi:hypothetical protein
MEQHLHLLRATERLLLDPTAEREWWGPLRRGEWLARRPDRVDVFIKPESFAVKFHFTDAALPGVAAHPVDAWLAQGLFTAWVSATPTGPVEVQTQC